MTKKDFKIIAEALRNVVGGNYVEIVDSLVEYLSADNPRFDKDKFYNACGILER